MQVAFIGGAGHHNIRGALPVDGSASVAVASDGYDREAALRFHAGMRERFGGLDVRWFENPDELLHAMRPDVVSVGGVYGYGGDIIASFLQQDIPVVSDKPIAATWQQLERIRALVAEKPTRRLITEFDFRSRRDVRSTELAVRDGLIGDVVLITAQKSYRFGTRPAWYANRVSYGGTLLWVASHALDGIAFITGQKLTSFAGRQNNLTRPALPGMEDHTVVVAALSGGGTAVAHADFLRPSAAEGHGDDRFRVAGSLGVIEVRDNRATLLGQDGKLTDITELAPPPRPLAAALLGAAMGESSEQYNTAASLETADMLLRARDAADRGIG